MILNNKEYDMYVHTDLPPEAIPIELFDFLKVIEAGAKKYALNNWLKPDGGSCDEKTMHDKMFHHLARSFWAGEVQHTVLDAESGLDHLLHLACRALMLYTRRKRGIIHSVDDKIFYDSVGDQK